MYTPIKKGGDGGSRAKEGTLRDAGMEDSIIRNIARTQVSAASVLSPPELLSNTTVLQLLSNKGGSNGVILDILDMAVC